MKNSIFKYKGLKTAVTFGLACLISISSITLAFPTPVMAAETSLSQEGALGSVDVSSIKLGTKYARPKDIIYTTFQANRAEQVTFRFRYFMADGRRGYKECYATKEKDYDSETGLWTIKTVIPSNAAAGTWQLFDIVTVDENGKSAWIVTNSDVTLQNYPEATDLTIGDFTIVDAPQAPAEFDPSHRILPHYDITKDGGEIITDKNGEMHYILPDGDHIHDAFFYDGTYTYFLQYNGTPMKNVFTYHPDGEHLVYFDENGHELFSTFHYCPTVGYTCYFGSDGYLYKDQITFVGDKTYYLNGNGALEQNGWFQFANGLDYGYANSDGSLITTGWGQDPLGRTVFYHWNGMVARGLITDGIYYYYMDETDGHYIGQFQ